MRPLIWTNRADGALAGILIAWLLATELGTSRIATRQAAADDSERVVDTSTSRLCDAALGLALVGGVAASRRHPRSAFVHQRAAFVAGSAAVLASGALSTVARRHLGRFHRDALTVHADHVLVESGPYSSVRHPLYTATIGAVAGIGLLLGSRVSLGLAALPASALVKRIGVEEAMLTEALGEVYVAYSSRTARLIPGIW